MSVVSADALLPSRVDPSVSPCMMTLTVFVATRLEGSRRKRVRPDISS